MANEAGQVCSSRNMVMAIEARYVLPHGQLGQVWPIHSKVIANEARYVQFIKIMVIEAEYDPFITRL